MIPLWTRDPQVGWHHVIDNEIFGCFKIWTAFINWVSELWNLYKCSYDGLTSFSNKKTRCLCFMNVHEFKIKSRVTPQITWSHIESRDKQKIVIFTPAFSFRPIIMSIRQSLNSAWTFEILVIFFFLISDHVKIVFR